MIFAVVVIAYPLVFFILGFKLAMWSVRKYIKDVSSEVDTVYKNDKHLADSAFYTRVYNKFLN